MQERALWARKEYIINPKAGEVDIEILDTLWS
jgi:hypothetical protein